MPVLFFDGECVLCNATARWVARYNRSGNIRFASLQGIYAKKKLKSDFQTGDSLVFTDGDRVLTRSAAVFEILKYLPAWRWLRTLRFLPERLADRLYDGVAKNRFRWFGKQTECRVAPPGLRERFIAD